MSRSLPNPSHQAPGGESAGAGARELPQADAPLWTPAKGELRPVDLPGVPGGRRVWEWHGSGTRLHKTPIEWADYTINPLLVRDKQTGKVGWGCQKVSAGCKNCYAEAMNGRNLPARGTGLSYSADAQKRIDPVLDVDALTALVKAKPRGPFKNGRDRAAVFPCDMTDLGWDFWPVEWLDLVFASFALAPGQDMLVLTKRPERMAGYLNDMRRQVEITNVVAAGAQMTIEMGQFWSEVGWPLPNVMLGTSCEDQAAADARIPHLINCPAVARFLSCEPLLGLIDLHKPFFESHLRSQSLMNFIHGLIVGGESGPGARPCDVANIRSIVRQGQDAGLPVFVKQLGKRIVVANDSCSEWPRDGDEWLYPADTDVGYQGDPIVIGLEDPKGGDPSEWPEDLRVRQMPQPAEPTP